MKFFGFISLFWLGCDNTDTFSPVNTVPDYHVKSVVYNSSVTSVTDQYPFYSLLYKSCFPYGQAETFKDEVELSFCVVDGTPKLISPADRVIFNLPVYSNALFSTFMTTGITRAQFDTLETDYLFFNLSAGKYNINLTSKMPCIFFQSVNGTYGLIQVNSIIASGLNNSAAVISFEVKYVRGY